MNNNHHIEIDYLGNTSATVLDLTLSTHATDDYHHINLNYDGVPINYLWISSINYICISENELPVIMSDITMSTSIIAIIAMDNDGEDNI